MTTSIIKTLNECREIIKKIKDTKDDGVYSHIYTEHVSKLIRIISNTPMYSDCINCFSLKDEDRPRADKCNDCGRIFLGRDNPRINPEIKYKGSITDFATDIAYEISAVHAVMLITELDRFIKHEPTKFQNNSTGDSLLSDVVNSVNNPEIKSQIPSDPVNPAHYKGDTVMVFIEQFNLGFCEGNAVKYIARHQSKGTPLEDLRKARWYLDRAISNHETEKINT